MENFNSFPLNNCEPCPDFQNTVTPITQHASPPLHPHHISQCSGEFDSSECQNSFPFEVTSGGPIRQNAHSVESLQDQHKKFQAKLARANRKMARKMSAMKKTIVSISSSSSSTPSASRPSRAPQIDTSSNINKSSDEEYIFYEPYNVVLSLVLRKFITPSDVNEQGRILLPKREAEENLPSLATKEGVQIVMKELFTNTMWKIRYRFWANYKGRMYLLDQCGEFIKENKLEAGDQLKLYQDELKNLYFIIDKKAKHAAEASNVQANVGNSDIYMRSEGTEEMEDLSLRMLVEDLKHKEDEKSNTLYTLYPSDSSLAG